MKVYREGRCKAPLILNHGPGWMRVVNFTPPPLGKETRYPLNRRLAGLQRFGVKVNLLLFLGFEPWTIQLVT